MFYGFDITPVSPAGVGAKCSMALISHPFRQPGWGPNVLWLWYHTRFASRGGGQMFYGFGITPVSPAGVGAKCSMALISHPFRQPGWREISYGFGMHPPPPPSLPFGAMAVSLFGCVQGWARWCHCGLRQTKTHTNNTGLLRILQFTEAMLLALARTCCVKPVACSFKELDKWASA